MEIYKNYTAFGPIYNYWVPNHTMCGMRSRYIVANILPHLVV